MDDSKVVRDLMTSFVLLVKNNYFWQKRREKTFKVIHCTDENNR